MVTVPKVPSIPSAKPVANPQVEELNAIKRQLNEIDSWELTPADRMELKFTEMADEAKARAFVKAHEL